MLPVSSDEEDEEEEHKDEEDEEEHKDEEEELDVPLTTESCEDDINVVSTPTELRADVFAVLNSDGEDSETETEYYADPDVTITDDQWSVDSDEDVDDGFRLPSSPTATSLGLGEW
jgi:hypothetical protein